MARKPRFSLPDVPQHLIQRGNNRSPCFFSENDYLFYLECLQEAADRHLCAVHAFVLMTNHVHLLVTPGSQFGLSHMMQRLGQRYVQYINRAYRRSGTLWEGRYKACLIESEHYLMTCQRYIELNPVRACMVGTPAEYRWSSYRYHAAGEPMPCLTPHSLYLSLGGGAAERQLAYRTLFGGHLDKALIHDIRDTLNQELVLGSERFKNEIENTLARQVRPGKDGRPRK